MESTRGDAHHMAIFVVHLVFYFILFNDKYLSWRLGSLLHSEDFQYNACQGPLQRHVAISVLLYCFILSGPVDVPGGTFSRAQQADVTSRI